MSESHREAFLAALAANEDDTDTRLIYADWLEERGESAEADRQRRWPESKAWLVRFCETEDSPSYDLVVRAAMSPDGRYSRDDYGVVIDEYGIYSGGRSTSGSIPSEFWEHLSIVTGKKFPVIHDGYFRCSC